MRESLHPNTKCSVGAMGQAAGRRVSDGSENRPYRESVASADCARKRAGPRDSLSRF